MTKSVAVIGAGPVGLAAAAHLLERGLQPIVLEAGPEAGHSVRQWQHVQLFSPWAYSVDKAAGRLLAPTGWNSPDPDVYPTGAELLERYIMPLATRDALEGCDPNLDARHGDKPRRLRQGEDCRSRKRAIRNPIPERQGAGDAPRGCRHRHIGDMVVAQSRRRQRAAGDR